MDVQKVQYIKHHVFDGPGRGLQCVANAVCAILHRMKKVPPSWKPSDIDEILHKGYMLYQHIGKVGRLLPSDIPEYISVDELWTDRNAIIYWIIYIWTEGFQYNYNRHVERCVQGIQELFAMHWQECISNIKTWWYILHV